jgi:hypothetical protein
MYPLRARLLLLVCIAALVQVSRAAVVACALCLLHTCADAAFPCMLQTPLRVPDLVGCMVASCGAEAAQACAFVCRWHPLL